MGFEWDPAKSRANLDKHGVTFEEALAVFADADSLRQDVVRPALVEDRIKIIGKVDDRFLTVVYTLRSSNLRIISARRSHRSERRDYARQSDT